MPQATAVSRQSGDHHSLSRPMITGADDPSLSEGQRVASATRTDFPLGTVLRILGDGYVLVRWDGNVLETAHHQDLIRVERDC